MEKNSVCIFGAVRETMKGEKQDVYTKKKDYDRTVQTSRIKKHYWEGYYQKPIINIQRRKIYLLAKGQRC